MIESSVIASRKEGMQTGLLVAAVIVVPLWAALIVVLGTQDVFAARSDQAPIATLTAIALPPALFLCLLRAPRIHRAVLALDPVWLAAVHGLRILGAGFLFVYAFGHLPGLFAHVAGWGDVLVAVLAPFVAAKLAADHRFFGSSGHLGFHVIGLLDFLAAVLSGLVARGTIPLLDLSESTAALGDFPLLLVPCFAVPLWICLHIAAIAQIRAIRRRHSSFPTHGQGMNARGGGTRHAA